MYAVRGNHEDHEFLDNLENHSDKNTPYFCIDCYGMVNILKTGYPLVLNNGFDDISLMGIGRIGDMKGREDKKFIQEYERIQLQQTYQTCGDLDILISHDKPSESIRGYGSSDVAQALDNIAFPYHFYGHTGEPFNESLADNGITNSVKIKELEFNAKGKLEEGCMMILEKENHKISLIKVPLFDIVHFDKQSWHNL